MFRSPRFNNCLFIYLAFVWFNHDQNLDPALNVYFIGEQTVCIDWTLQVLLSFKWVEQVIIAVI